MTRDEAKAIIAEVNPDLNLDESRPELDYLLSFYREDDTHRTNYDLRTLDEAMLREICAGL